MLQRSTIQLLRFHFSFFLLPVYLFAISQLPVIYMRNAVLIFIILHLLVYPSSNGYNSYMDRDESPIGGLAKPLQPTRQLFFVTLIMDALAVLASLLVSAGFALGILLYILASRAYSYRGVRLKRYAVLGFLTVFICQGALIFVLVYHGAGSNRIMVNAGRNVLDGNTGMISGDGPDALSGNATGNTRNASNERWRDTSPGDKYDRALNDGSLRGNTTGKKASDGNMKASGGNVLNAASPPVSSSLTDSVSSHTVNAAMAAGQQHRQADKEGKNATDTVQNTDAPDGTVSKEKTSQPATITNGTGAASGTSSLTYDSSATAKASSDNAPAVKTPAANTASGATFSALGYDTGETTGLIPFRNIPLLPALTASLLIGALYPLTQVYQHDADRRDGITTISMLLGKRGSFIFSGLLFLGATLCLYIRFYQQGAPQLFYRFLLIMFPVVLFFLYWMVKVWRNGAAADFSHSLRMNIVSTLCTTVFFITLI